MIGGATSTSFGANDQLSGQIVSKKSGLSPAVCGSPSMRYWVVAVLLPPTSTLQPSIVFSTIKLPVFALLLLVLLHPSSRLHLLVASYESSHQSLQLKSSRW